VGGPVGGKNGRAVYQSRMPPAAPAQRSGRMRAPQFPPGDTVSPLANIRIVLVNTTHPGNIGAVARAMKNMGLEQLWLVAPSHYPDREASDRAANARDLLNRAVVVES